LIFADIGFLDVLCVTFSCKSGNKLMQSLSNLNCSKDGFYFNYYMIQLIVGSGVSLRSICLSGCLNLTDEGIKDLMPCMRELVKLDLSVCPISHSDLFMILDESILILVNYLLNVAEILII